MVQRHIFKAKFSSTFLAFIRTQEALLDAQWLKLAVIRLLDRIEQANSKSGPFRANDFADLLVEKHLTQGAEKEISLEDWAKLGRQFQHAIKRPATFHYLQVKLT